MAWPSKKPRRTSPNWTNNVEAPDGEPESVKTPVRASAGLKRGKKSIHWDVVRASLKIKFEKAEITRCEKCNSGFNLRFCHRLKRRFITTEDELHRCPTL